MDTIITVEGLSETVAMLQQASKTIIASGFVNALSEAGNVIGDALEVAAPVKKDENDFGGLLKEQGELRDSVMVAVELDTGLRGGRVNVGFTSENSAASVALWVNDGHRIVVAGGFYIDNRGKRRKGTEIGMVPPNPFMLRAFDASKEAAIEAFSNSIAETVKRAFPQGVIAA